MNHFLAYFYWYPNREIFTIPFINHPVAWYGLFFVLGFIVGYMIIIPMIMKLLSKSPILERDIADWTVFSNSPNPDLNKKNKILKSLNKYGRKKAENLYPKGIKKLKEISMGLADRLVWFVIIGGVVGARLGHVFFYDLPRYQNNLLDIFKVWEGGLASHGGGIGILVAIYFYHKSVRNNYPELTYLTIFDTFAVPAAFGAFSIRIGNFMNQEILGTVTNVPWAVIMGHPMDGSAPIPRHPTQLYEAFVYLITFFILITLYIKKSDKLKSGTLAGYYLILIFGTRFFLEFIKKTQGNIIDESFLQTGQYLSIPAIILGLILIKPRFLIKSSPILNKK